MPPIEEHHLRISGRHTCLWTGGSGPPMLLIHGGLGDAELHWRAVWERLAETHRVLAPDLPGFGGTEALENASFPAYADWCAAVLEAHDAEGALVVGNSFGAAVARLLAARRPDLVRRVVLVNGGAIPEVPPLARRLLGQRWLTAPLFGVMRRRAFSRTSMARMFAQPERILTAEFLRDARRDSHAFVAAMREAALGPPSGEAQPGVPIDIYWGEADGLSPIKEGRRLSKTLPGSRLQLIPGAGHMPQLEQPETFVQMLLEA